MKVDPIQRDANGLAHTEYCHETPDGGLDLVAGHIRYQLAPDRIADGPALGQTLLDLRLKSWFTEAIQCDFTNVVTARWLAKARGWIRPT
jgi:hypothetical protein